jgi:hypothetical protein
LGFLVAPFAGRRGWASAREGRTVDVPTNATNERSAAERRHTLLKLRILEISGLPRVRSFELAWGVGTKRTAGTTVNVESGWVGDQETKSR